MKINQIILNIIVFIIIVVMLLLLLKNKNNNGNYNEINNKNIELFQNNPNITNILNNLNREISSIQDSELNQISNPF